MKFSDGFKQSMVEKLLMPGGKGATELSKEIGVREGLPNSLKELEDFITSNSIKQIISKIV